MTLITRSWAVGLAAAGAAGLVILTLAWSRADGVATVDDQMSWAAVGLCGAGMTGLAALTALTVARRAIRGRLRAVTGQVQRYLVLASAGATVEVGDDLRVVAPGMRHYHRRDCPLVAGKAARPAGLAPAARSSLRPCAVCDA